MSDNRWQRIEDIFHQAVKLAPEARSAFLDEVCAGDESLRTEVESLLAHDAGDGSTFVNVVAVVAADETATIVEDLTGRTIGPYKVLGRIGAGGMGVVYQARDTQLDRTVAIKVLPADRLADADRQRRFIQEAKAASALNHPNIVTIFGITHEGGSQCIVMEYVAGKTLADAIPKKGLPLRQALRIAIEIADAMAAAHAAGIVHRDLKPSNVMLTEAGRVKVLDFGLAKLVEGGEPTETSPGTETGKVVGTAAYMSPEQAQGRKVDGRTDIFAFGCVLYEMVTGRRAFQAESTLSTLAAILHEEPAPIEGVAPEVSKLIGRCLRKDPARRYQHMDELKLALEEMKEESDSGKLPATAPRRPHVYSWAVPVAALLLVCAAGVIWWLARSPKPSPAPVLTRLTSDSGLTTDPALSPDGKLLAYASDRSGDGNLDIWVRQVDGGEPIRLTRDPADEREPAFSPNGTQIAFRSEREGGGIYLTSALGGQPARRVAPEGRRPQFSPDGSWIAYWAGGLSGANFSIRNQCRIYVVPSAGGTPRQVQADFAAAAYPVWSPDGTRLLFLGNRDNKGRAEESVDWWITPLGPGPAIRTGAFLATRTEQLRGALRVYPWALAAPTWQPDGDSLIFSARSGDSTNLWRIGISQKTSKATGRPQRLTSGPTLEEQPTVALGPGGSTRVAFASLNENVDIWSLPIEANQGKVTGALQRLTQDAAADFHPALSADGSRMVFVSGRSGSQEVWIKDLRSGEESALTASGLNKYLPHFSPDGSKVSFSSYENNKWNIYVVPTGGGTPEMICEDCGEASGWSSDGRRLVGNDVRGRMWLLDVASRRKTPLLALPNRWLAAGHLSPDQRWITLLDGGAHQSYIAPFRGETPIEESMLISTFEGFGMGWSPDGASLYGTSGQDGYLCIWAKRVNPVTKFPAGSQFAIFHAHSARLSLANQDDPQMFTGRDRVVFSMGERTGNIWMAEWKER